MEPIHDPRRYENMGHLFKVPPPAMEPLHYENMGLRGVRTATTEICKVDGEKGKLIYRGYSIEELVKGSSYEEVCYLLLKGEMPLEEDLRKFSERFAGLRELPEEASDLLRVLPKDTNPMMALQSAVAFLGCLDGELEDRSNEANLRKGMRIIARMPTIVAAWNRIRNGLEPVPPSHRMSHAADFLRMMRGETPDQGTAEVMDKVLVLHAEHSFNASTFTARVVSSTRSNMYASISAAIGSLAGELHGGANVRVMETLLEIGDPDGVAEWVRAKLDAGERVMGMGHAIYKTVDPRARILKELADRTTRGTEHHRWYRITERLEQETQEEIMRHKGRTVCPNVDLYSAGLYHSMGIPMDLFTAVFAIARSAGWVAHILEEKFPTPPIRPMLYRPSATYVGRYCGASDCAYVPMEERGRERGDSV